uniref:Uncharacterized protein n=1 Tax=Triticum urartu TaxID=4572 RepID=A0A8R7VKE9_TRIUA
MASTPSLLTLLLALVLPLIPLAVAAPEKHLVTHLPGFDGALPSKHYAGYISVEVLSERARAADPVVLWLNGGPGCSSFDGFVYENGPFNFERGSTPGGLPKLHLNPYSWSKVIRIPDSEHSLGAQAYPAAACPEFRSTNLVQLY